MLDRVVIHFLYPDPQGKIVSGGLTLADGTPYKPSGRYTAACQPSRSQVNQNFRCTGEAWLVDCEKCKQSEAYQQADKTPPTVRVDMISEENIQAAVRGQAVSR